MPWHCRESPRHDFTDRLSLVGPDKKVLSRTLLSGRLGPAFKSKNYLLCSVTCPEAVLVVWLKLYWLLCRWDGVPPDFGKELFENDMDVLLRYFRLAIKRMPVLAKAEIASVISGPITYSPDAMPMLGPAPELPNMWMAAGSGYGIGHAGNRHHTSCTVTRSAIRCVCLSGALFRFSCCSQFNAVISDKLA